MATELDFVLVGLAAVFAGAVNALAGGGTLITFPVLIAVGVPPVVANVTNTVALCPGYLGAAFAQHKDLRGAERRLRLLLPPAIIGGVAGGILLFEMGERTFRVLVPFLILAASGLLAIQETVRTRIAERRSSAAVSETWAVFPIGLAAVYGGYFGAGLSVILLSVLGAALNDSLTRLNAVKQTLALAVNTAAAVFFVFSGRVLWSMAFVMAAGALAGGVLGGRLAGRIKAGTLRWTVVSIGTVVGILYLLV